MDDNFQRFVSQGASRGHIFAVDLSFKLVQTSHLSERPYNFRMSGLRILSLALDLVIVAAAQPTISFVRDNGGPSLRRRLRSRLTLLYWLTAPDSTKRAGVTRHYRSHPQGFEC